MDKKKIKRPSAKATLAAVTKEMAKPRVSKSVREQNQIYRNEDLVVVENHIQK